MCSFKFCYIFWGILCIVCLFVDDFLGVDVYWVVGFYVYMFLLFRLGWGGLGDRIKIYLFVNIGNLIIFDISMIRVKFKF